MTDATVAPISRQRVRSIPRDSVSRHPALSCRPYQSSKFANICISYAESARNSSNFSSTAIGVPATFPRQ